MSNSMQLNIRCSEEQHARWSEAAVLAKRKLADWARLKIDEGHARDATQLAAQGRARRQSPNG
jgi:hypothetical protein